MDQLTAHDPRRIGPFEVLGRLGAGGMGLVYLARSASGRRVAIKTVRAELAEDELFRVRFSREISAAKTISGFYTAAVVDADADAPVPWLATAYVPAPSLEDLVDECGPLPVEAVRWLAAGIAEALQSIHAAGLVHRDLKPSNVLVVEDGPRVIDFGIAAGVSHTRLTMTNVAVGTPAYMSPEQARDSRSVTGASDVFSLGSLLVYAATGHPPYRGANPVETVFMLLREQPDLSGLPEELAPLVRSCMRPALERRPTPAEIQAELAPHLFARGDSGGDGDAEEWLPPPALDLIERKRGRRTAVAAPPPPPSPGRLSPSRPPLSRPRPGRPPGCRWPRGSRRPPRSPWPVPAPPRPSRPPPGGRPARRRPPPAPERRDPGHRAAGPGAVGP
ncbi:serine/threonine-protein kinase [Peterkaempfera bronchialis]|uniref:serine/threonine-protein kinase n=1 Tax=Peterkaempfera bronchialis TaxID=2126346 RepID=UPI001E4C462F|nr:serine/threonine-protein kinase [Peterkaempfera bronchialis]